MRILDSGLRDQFSGLGDICAPLEEVASLDITPTTAFIVENIQTALAFTDIESGQIVPASSGNSVNG